MPEDKIVAAERSILEIAAELKRLRDAANLLNGAQTQIDGVLTAVKGVIDSTREFTAVCGPIVEKLASSDIIRKLDDLELSHQKQREALEEVGGKVQAGDEQARVALQAAIDTLSDVEKLASSAINRKLDDLELSHQKQREALEAVGGKVQAGDEQARVAMQAAIDTLSDVEKLASAAIIRKLDALELSHQEQREVLEAVGGKVQAGDEQARAAMQAAIDTLSERLALANLADFGRLNAGLADVVGSLRTQTQELRLEIVSAVQAAAALAMEGAAEKEVAAIERSSETHALLAAVQASFKDNDARFVLFELANRRRELAFLVMLGIGLLALVRLLLA